MANVSRRRALLVFYHLMEGKNFREIGKIIGFEASAVHRAIHKYLKEEEPELYKLALAEIEKRKIERPDRISEGSSRYQESIRHKRINNCKPKKSQMNIKQSKPVIFIEADGSETTYFSMAEASRRTGFSTETIQRHCKGNAKKIRFKWIKSSWICTYCKARYKTIDGSPLPKPEVCDCGNEEFI